MLTRPSSLSNFLPSSIATLLERNLVLASAQGGRGSFDPMLHVNKIRIRLKRTDYCQFEKVALEAIDNLAITQKATFTLLLDTQPQKNILIYRKISSCN